MLDSTRAGTHINVFAILYEPLDRSKFIGQVRITSYGDQGKRLRSSRREWGWNGEFVWAYNIARCFIIEPLIVLSVGRGSIPWRYGWVGGIARDPCFDNNDDWKFRINLFKHFTSDNNDRTEISACGFQLWNPTPFSVIKVTPQKQSSRWSFQEESISQQWPDAHSLPSQSPFRRG